MKRSGQHFGDANEMVVNRFASISTGFRSLLNGIRKVAETHILTKSLKLSLEMMMPSALY